MPVRPRGKSWQADFRVAGVRYRPTLGPEIETKKQAEAEERRLRAEVEASAREQAKVEAAPETAARPRAAFSGFAHTWLEEHIRIRRKPSVYRGYEMACRVHLVPFFGDRQLTSIVRRDVERFVAQLAATPHPDTGARRAPKSVNNTLAVLTSLLSTAVEWGYLEKSPATGVEPLPIPVDSQEFAFYTAEESDRWLAACAEIEPAWYPWCLLSFRTGLRLGELAALRWSDVDLPGRRLHVRRAWYRGEVTTPKGGRSRLVDLCGSAAALLGRLGRRPGVPLVFANDDGSYVTRDQLKAPWERVTRAAGLHRTTPHDARHSFASQLIMAGEGVPAVQQLLGHTDIRVTMRYAHLAPAAKASAVAALDRRGGREAPTEGFGHKLVTAVGMASEDYSSEASLEGGGGGSRTRRGRQPKLRLISGG